MVFSFNENIWKELTSLSQELSCVLPRGNLLSLRQVFLSAPYAASGNSIILPHKLKKIYKFNFYLPVYAVHYEN